VAPVDSAPYPDEGYNAPGASPQQDYQRGSRAAFSGSTAPSVPEPSLTVIFKSGRAPVKVQNYILTARALTDLDSQHHEQIPIDQIDVTATKQANSAAGLDFQIPGQSNN
jgi:hypothetical protein